jgi:hypothetical protein
MASRALADSVLNRAPRGGAAQDVRKAARTQQPNQLGERHSAFNLQGWARDRKYQ